MAKTWDRHWSTHEAMSFSKRKRDFFKHRKRQSTIDSLIVRLRDYAKVPVGEQLTVLFGNGAAGGGWGHLKGVKERGPVLEIQARLARDSRINLIAADEWRTSKLCLHCGHELQMCNRGRTVFCVSDSCHKAFPKRDSAAEKTPPRVLGVAQLPCGNRSTSPMNRDVSAAFKIGARFLAFAKSQREDDLGPFGRGAPCLASKAACSDVLLSALKEYQAAHATAHHTA